jgi:hypothetical protein
MDSMITEIFILWIAFMVLLILIDMLLIWKDVKRMEDEDD